MEFVIDGKVRWDEGNPPYTYGDDRNWLVTAWLSPGRHSFVVRATAKDGRVALQKTTARVVAAPSPPAELIGTWKHSLQGTWVLKVDRTGWKIRDPFGTGNFIDVATSQTGDSSQEVGSSPPPRAPSRATAGAETRTRPSTTDGPSQKTSSRSPTTAPTAAETEGVRSNTASGTATGLSPGSTTMSPYPYNVPTS